MTLRIALIPKMPMYPIRPLSYIGSNMEVAKNTDLLEIAPSRRNMGVLGSVTLPISTEWTLTGLKTAIRYKGKIRCERPWEDNRQWSIYLSLDAAL